MRTTGEQSQLQKFRLWLGEFLREALGLAFKFGMYAFFLWALFYLIKYVIYTSMGMEF